MTLLPTSLTLTGCTVDLARGVVHRDDEELRLTTREAQLLAYLVARPSRVIPRDELLAEVFGYSDAVTSRATDNQVRRLRQKIEVDPAKPDHLLTVFGEGYRFLPATRELRPENETPTPAPARRVHLGSASLDLGKNVVTRGEETVVLTAIEAAIVAFLLDRPGRAVSRRELLRHVWDRRSSNPTRAVDKAMLRLRTKIEEEPSEPRFLLSVRGQGYKLQLDRPDVPPKGEICIVTVDVHGADLLWDQVPAAMDVAVSLQERELGRLATLHRGHVVHRDGAAERLVFAEPSDALRWAVQTQERLTEVAWPDELLDTEPARPLVRENGSLLFRGPRLRMVLHSGKPIRRVDSSTGAVTYQGAPIREALARLPGSPAGHILATAAAWARIDRSTRALVEAVQTEGGWRLTPITLANRPAGAVGVPADDTSFVGRRGDLAALTQALDEHRAVALTGAGGLGKTRLAAHTVRSSANAIWCDLAAARDLDDAIRRVAGALGLALSAAADPTARVGQALAGRQPLLVVLDNVEQITDAATELLEAWDLEGVSFLLTSRHRIESAHAMALQPLSVDDAVALFLARARCVQPDLPENNGVIAELVTRLDRLPLAIELVASRVGVLSPEQLLDRMEARFQVLPVALEERLAWSWELLHPVEQAALAQASVFRGGFTLDAAEAVIDLSAFEESDVIEVIEGLRHKSLLDSRAAEHGGVRLSMFESVRAFAAAHRGESGALERYFEYFGEYGSADYLNSVDGHRGLERYRELVAELDNLIEVARSADPHLAAPCAIAAVRVLSASGPFSLGRELTQNADAIEDPELAGQLWLAHSKCCRGGRQLNVAMGAALDQAEEIGVAHGLESLLLSVAVGRVRAEIDAANYDQVSAACLAVVAPAEAAGDSVLATMFRAQAAQFGGDGYEAESEALWTAAAAASRSVGNDLNEAAALGRLGQVLWAQGRVNEARRALERASRIYRLWNSHVGLDSSMNYLAYLASERGDLEEFYALNTATLEQTLAMGKPAGQGLAHLDRAHVLRVEGRVDEALVALEHAKALLEAYGPRQNVAYLQVRTAEVYLDAGDLTGARAAANASFDLYTELGMVWPIGVVESVRADIARVGGALDEARGHIDAAEETLRETDNPNDLAVLLCRRALIDRAQGRVDADEAALAEARAIATATGAGPRSEVGRHLERATP